MSRTTEAENEAPWQKVLSRWALAYGLYEVAALLAFATVVGFDVLGPGAFEAAARNPATFRIAAGLDLTAAAAAAVRRRLDLAVRKPVAAMTTPAGADAPSRPRRFWRPAASKPCRTTSPTAAASSR